MRNAPVFFFIKVGAIVLCTTFSKFIAFNMICFIFLFSIDLGEKLRVEWWGMRIAMKDSCRGDEGE